MDADDIETCRAMQHRRITEWKTSRQIHGGKKSLMVIEEFWFEVVRPPTEEEVRVLMDTGILSYQLNYDTRLAHISFASDKRKFVEAWLDAQIVLLGLERERRTTDEADEA